MTPDLVTHMHVLIPEGAGPFPVLVQMHGCGGVQPMQHRYAEAACRAGVAVVVLDSLTPRGIGRLEAMMTVCTAMRLRGAERACDLTAALEWACAQAWADKSRLAVAGWSHGGWTAMDALADPNPNPILGDLRLAILVYPYAGLLSKTSRCGWGSHQPKVFACLAGRDSIVGTAAPMRAMDRLRADGLDVDLLHLADATHAFDDDAARDPRIRYRPDYEALLQSRYIRALVDAFGLYDGRHCEPH